MQLKMEAFSAVINLETFLEEAIKQEGMYEVVANLVNVFSEIRSEEGYSDKEAKKIIKHLDKICEIVD